MASENASLDASAHQDAHLERTLPGHAAEIGGVPVTCVPPARSLELCQRGGESTQGSHFKLSRVASKLVAPEDYVASARAPPVASKLVALPGTAYVARAVASKLLVPAEYARKPAAVQWLGDSAPEPAVR